MRQRQQDGDRTTLSATSACCAARSRTGASCPGVNLTTVVELVATCSVPTKRQPRSSQRSSSSAAASVWTSNSPPLPRRISPALKGGRHPRLHALERDEVTPGAGL